MVSGVTKRYLGLYPAYPSHDNMELLRRNYQGLYMQFADAFYKQYGRVPDLRPPPGEAPTKDLELLPPIPGHFTRGRQRATARRTRSGLGVSRAAMG